MGFGSYDESEQERQKMNVDEEEETEHETLSRHNGEMEFNNEDTDDLLDVFHNEVEHDSE